MSSEVPPMVDLDAKEQEMLALYPGFGSDEDDSSEDEKSPGRLTAEELKSFKKTKLWEGPRLPYYDERKAGPKNVPPGAKRFTGHT